MADTPAQPTNDLTAPTLDHLALASEQAWDNMIRYCYHLGARWLGGADEDEMPAFYFSQALFAGGTKLEFLQPNPVPGSDFLRRFIYRNGPGPHHVTFKVPDIRAAIADVAASGYQVVSENFDSPDWQEAFLHPKQSHGIVVQLAQPGGDGSWDTPESLPPSMQAARPRITRINHLVADLASATKLFTGPLAMELGQQGSDNAAAFVDVVQGPWTIRLQEPGSDLHRHWLGHRTGRLFQVDIAVDEPGRIPDLRPRDNGWELPPDKNQGTRLFITKLDQTAD